MERYEKSGAIGAATGWARWEYDKRVTIGNLTIEIQPSERPVSSGIVVDW